MQILHNPLGDSLPRLLIVCWELLRGGGAYLAQRHANQLRKHYAVDVLVTGPSDATFLKEFSPEIRIFTLDQSSRQADAPLGASLTPFLEQYQALEPFHTTYDVLLATSIFPNGKACAVAASIAATRRLLFLVDESLAGYLDLGPRERNVIAWAIRQADLVLPVSQSLWRRLAEACPPLRARPWQRLFPPVNVDQVRLQALEPQTLIPTGERPVIVTVARLTPGKQIDLCIQVHARLKSAGVHFRWYVIGSGSEEQTLRRLIRDHELESDFHLLGPQNNVHACMQAADVFALFSASEGCPTVILEAITLGLPVITTAVHGADEMIEHEQTGIIVRNQLEDIVRELRRLVEDESLRQRLRSRLAEKARSETAPREWETLPKLLQEPKEAVVPRVSILIPTYNQQQFIRKAIVSALDQDYAALEVVLLDDASTDDTEQLACAWLRDPRFRYVRNPQNRGRVANYHHGLYKVVRGEWVLVLDGDDFLTDSGFIRNAMDALTRNADRSILFAQAGHRVHYLNGDRPDTEILPPIDAKEQVVGGGEYLKRILATGFFSHLGALFNREAALRIGFYTANLRSSDLESFVRLALEGEVLLLNQIAGCWVQHGGNASSNLELGEIRANVDLFAAQVRLAIQGGAGSWRDFARPLRRHQAATLLHLFGCTVGKCVRGPLALATLVRLAFQINPALLVEGRFLAGLPGVMMSLLQAA